MNKQSNSPGARLKNMKNIDREDSRRKRNWGREMEKRENNMKKQRDGRENETIF